MGTMLDEKKVAEKIAKDTIPDDDNVSVIKGMLTGANVVEQFHNETNGWMDIHDVRVYDENTIGIAADWKWTIERWVAEGMGEMLESNGWSEFAHLKADRRKEPNEAEFRFRKEYGSVSVFLNCYVEFTERAFDALDKGKEKVEYGNEEAANRIKRARERMSENSNLENVKDLGES